MDEAVREQGGVVRGFTGDGIMAVFGAPVAFEDAPLRAVGRRWVSCNGSRQRPDLEAKHGVRRNYASVSTPGQRWSGKWRTVPTQGLRFSATR